MCVKQRKLSTHIHDFHLPIFHFAFQLDGKPSSIRRTQFFSGLSAAMHRLSGIEWIMWYIRQVLSIIMTTMYQCGAHYKSHAMMLTVFGVISKQRQTDFRNVFRLTRKFVWFFLFWCGAPTMRTNTNFSGSKRCYEFTIASKHHKNQLLCWVKVWAHFMWFSVFTIANEWHSVLEFIPRDTVAHTLHFIPIARRTLFRRYKMHYWQNYCLFIDI